MHVYVVAFGLDQYQTLQQGAREQKVLEVDDMNKVMDKRIVIHVLSTIETTPLRLPRWVGGGLLGSEEPSVRNTR